MVGQSVEEVEAGGLDLERRRELSPGLLEPPLLQTETASCWACYAIALGRNGLLLATATGGERVGLSPALGTFPAGVVLANSEYRHELEGDVAPFQGLLLGLFFIAVGAAVDFQLIGDEPAGTSSRCAATSAAPIRAATRTAARNDAKTLERLDQVRYTRRPEQVEESP